MSCERCGGSGYIPKFRHVEGGRCFLCNRGERYSSIIKDFVVSIPSFLTGLGNAAVDIFDGCKEIIDSVTIKQGTELTIKQLDELLDGVIKSSDFENEKKREYIHKFILQLKTNLEGEKYNLNDEVVKTKMATTFLKSLNIEAYENIENPSEYLIDILSNILDKIKNIPLNELIYIYNNLHPQKIMMDSKSKFKNEVPIFKLNNNGIYSLGEYEPYWKDKENKIVNPARDIHIIRMKNNDCESIALYTNKLMYILENSSNLKRITPIFTCVPSSKKGDYHKGLENIITRLPLYYDIENLCGSLHRDYDIEKLATGGDRNINVHFDSISVKNKENFKNRIVFILDDVTTTGNSLLACKKILEDCDASMVICIALGETVRY